MTAGELIKLIPPETFRKLAMETNVDAQVKKLSGEVVFKLILFSMLNSEKLSLRVMRVNGRYVAVGGMFVPGINRRQHFFISCIGVRNSRQYSF